MIKTLTLIFICITFVSCNFQSAEDDASGGGLFNNNSLVENQFLMLPTSERTYLESETIDITLAHSFSINVSGTPRIEVSADSGTFYADYLAGSGSKNITFRYTVQSGDNDIDGVNISNSIDLNGGTLTYLDSGITTNANVSILDVASSPLKIDTTVPQIISINPPLPDTYLIDEQFTISTTFDETVIVQGTPQIQVDIGGSIVNANYISGSGSINLLFAYTVKSGDLDGDGIEIQSPIDLNSGSIKDIAGNNANLILTPPVTPFALVDGDTPYVTSMSTPNIGTYYKDDNLLLTLNFSKIVSITGAPRIEIDVGGDTQFFNYISGSGTDEILFQYTVQEGEFDNDGISIANIIDLNSGTISDSTPTQADLNLSTPLTPGVMIDAQKPEVISIDVPTNGTYQLGNDLFFTASFNRNVTVSGVPRIPIDLQIPSTVYADYISGSGTDEIVFRYVVQSGELDLDGISIQGVIDLNAGDIISSSSVQAELDISTVSSGINTVGILVDAANPVVTSITPPADFNYLSGSDIDFTVTFSKPVNVTNSPQLKLDLDSSTVNAIYFGGSGSNSLVFRYQVVGADEDTDGIVLQNSIDLNITGSIQDSSLNNANLDLTAFIPSLTNVFANKSNAVITSITPPVDATYIEGENLDFIVNTNESIDVTGIPRLQLDIGGVTKYADYISGTGSPALTFRYTVEASLSDSDGIGVTSPIDLNSGTLQNSSALDLDLSFASPATSNVLIDSTPPQVTSISAPIDNNYITTNDLDFAVTFSKSVNVTNSPRLELTVGSSTLYANYLTGAGTSTLTFRYTVSGSDLDSDGIELVSSIDLNTTATIQDSNLNNANLDLTSFLPNLTNVFINKSTAVIDSITPPTDSTYLDTQNLDFIVNTNEIINISGTPRIELNIGGTSKFANYISGSGSTALVFRYTVETSLQDLDGIDLNSPIDANGGTLQNTGLQDLDLTFTPPVLTGVLVDSMPPTILSITPPADNTYLVSDEIDFTVNTDQVINVTGNPRIQIDIGGEIKYANYQSGTGTTALIFRYTVETGLYDNDGIEIVSPLDLNSGTLQNGTGANLDLVFTPPLMTSVFVDSAAPTINNITPPTNQTYIETDELDFVVNTSENVDVVGSPRIQIDIGGTIKYADYLSGTGTSALVFRYTVEAGLSDNDGIEIVSPLDLNAGTIQSSSLRNLELTYTPPIMGAVLVDSEVPIISISSPLDISYINNNSDSATYSITGLCSESGQTVSIEVDSSAAPSPVGFICDGTNFSGTIDTTSLSEASHTLQAKILDTSANEGVSSIINITKDTSSPSVSSVTPPTSTTYIDNDNIDFTLNMDDNVTVTGIPQIELDINGVSRFAQYLSGSGTPTLTFRYSVVTGEEDLDGIEINSTTINLNSGLLQDIALNDIDLDMETNTPLPALTSVFVDAVIPTVTITTANDITSANELNYSVTGTCSEDGRTVSVNIDGIILSPFCSSGSWTTGNIDVSGLLDNSSLPISANHNDLAGNTAIAASTTVDKSSSTPQVQITLSPDITSANVDSYQLSGTCTSNGVLVDINIGALNFQPNCSGGTWTTGFVDVSSVPDNVSLTITADHNSAVQASVNVAKDTLSATVVISSAPNISSSNESIYIASGTCSNNGSIVDVYIDTLNFQPNCSGGSWTTGSVDASSIADGSVTITADHVTATQAMKIISKNTSTPTISSLSVPTTLSESADLSWTTNIPGGFVINDYEINYRVKSTPTWLNFSDGISTNKFATVSSLTASTIYEFRVRILYDTSNYSDWSNTAEGETKPDDPLFNSPYAAMNVGGSTDTKVVAIYDNTRVYLNGVEIGASPISKGVPTSLPAHSRFDIVDADKPIFTAGRLGSGGNTAKGNIVWQPTSWAGKTFSFNSIRGNQQDLYVFATEDSTIQVKQGTTLLDSLTLTSGQGGTLTWTTYGSYQVISTGTILAYHISSDGGTRIEDPKPLLPSANEIIGFPSNSMRLTADFNSTNYNLVHSNSSSASGSINKQDVVQVNPQGGTTSLYRSESLVISADRKVSGASFADSNGNAASPFLPTSFMKTKYVINTRADYVAFASKLSGTIDVYSPAQTIGVSTPVQTLTLSRSGGATNAPYMVRLGTTTEGYRFVSSVPMAVWYQPDNDGGSADQDETILYGSD